MKLKNLAVVALLVAAAAGIMWYEPFYKSCAEITDNALRLHVVANSDSETDQQIKLEVRDAVLAATKDIVTGASGKEGAVAALAASLSIVESAANQTLKNAGYDYTARAYVCDMHFDTLSYGEATLPSGNYTAVRVELGQAEGKNWWCVMYPPLCVMAAGESEQELLDEAFTEEQAEIILGGEKYAVKFKLLELWEQFLMLFETE